MKTVIISENLHEARQLLAMPMVAGAVWRLAEELRSQLKHGHQFETIEDALEWCHGQVCEIVELIEEGA